MNIFRKCIAVILAFAISAFEPVGRDNRKEVKAEEIVGQIEWNIQAINAEESYQTSKKYDKIKVAVLDSGLDFDTEIPAVEKQDFLGDDELHPLYQDMTGHGTAVASVICANESEYRITGIAANVDLYIARILDDDNNAPVDRVVRAIDWAISKKVNIIHISFGTKKYSKDLKEAIDRAHKSGILIVASAGNDGYAGEGESSIEYPAAFQNVISVGATNTVNHTTEFSPTGEELDIVAPGDQILADGAFGGVCVCDGTSIAAAQVTGVAAVLWGKNPNKSNDFIKALLLKSANEDVLDGEECGNGLLDYAEAEDDYNIMEKQYNEYKKQGMSDSKAIAEAQEQLPENLKKVEEHTDVNYVNGLWHRQQHENAVKGIEQKYIDVVKDGAVCPDKIDGMRAPFFHGRGTYFVSTHYLLCLAKNYKRNSKKGKKIVYPTKKMLIKGGVAYPKEIYKDIKDEFKENNLMEKVFEYCEIEYENPTEEDLIMQRYALLGVALHNATDTFSHSVCRKTSKQYGNTWIHIVHEKKDSGKGIINRAAIKNIPKRDRKYFSYIKKYYICADDQKKLAPMYKLAQKMAQRVINDFEYGKKWFSYLYSIKGNKKLKLKNFSLNVKKILPKCQNSRLNATCKSNFEKPYIKLKYEKKYVCINIKKQKRFGYLVFCNKKMLESSGCDYKIRRNGKKKTKICVKVYYGNKVKKYKYMIDKKLMTKNKKKVKTKEKNSSKKTKGKKK
ncbi:MAG: S8 family serine peptidase [Eubacterium sp.]|nr:S8 family serine peptidase [Eubacterium sp.]